MKRLVSKPISYLERNEEFLGYRPKTPIQQTIERAVTSGRGYGNRRQNTVRTPLDLLNTEIGLQIALGNMETVDGRLGMDEVIGFSHQLEAMMSKFKKAGIPLSVITDANGFNKAFDWAYANPSNLLENREIQTLDGVIIFEDPLRKKDNKQKIYENSMYKFDSIEFFPKKIIETKGKRKEDNYLFLTYPSREII